MPRPTWHADLKSPNLLVDSNFIVKVGACESTTVLSMAGHVPSSSCWLLYAPPSAPRASGPVPALSGVRLQFVESTGGHHAVQQPGSDEPSEWHRVLRPGQQRWGSPLLHVCLRWRPALPCCTPAWAGAILLPAARGSAAPCLPLCDTPQRWLAPEVMRGQRATKASGELWGIAC